MPTLKVKNPWCKRVWGLVEANWHLYITKCRHLWLLSLIIAFSGNLTSFLTGWAWNSRTDGKFSGWSVSVWMPVPFCRSHVSAQKLGRKPSCQNPLFLADVCFCINPLIGASVVAACLSGMPAYQMGDIWFRLWQWQSFENMLGKWETILRPDQLSRG
jgi:hypothetical protein